MKKLLPTLFLPLIFSSSSFVYSQDYIPLVSSNKLWNILRNLNGDVLSTYTARIQEVDTVINGNTYQKIVSDTLAILPPSFYTDLGYLREDINEKKVYYINENSHVFFSTILANNEEVLLYDFSLEEGDTTKVLTTEWCGGNNDGLTKLKVIEIDSVELLDNTKRKRWQLENIDFNTDTVYWIEGIGSTFGLYMSSCTYTNMHGHHYDLLCYYEDNIHLYQRPMWNTCSYFWTSNVEEYGKKGVDFSVYPNPAQDEATIRVKDTERTYSIIITDLHGKIMSIHSEITDFIQLDIAQLSNGTYLVHLVEGETRIETKKLLKM